MIWDREHECMERGELEALQLSRLQEMVERIYNHVPFYKEKLDEADMSPEKITCLSDLQRLPFTTKTDLRDHYPFGMFSSPMEDIVRIHASSGTTGKPTVVGYTEGDLDIWREVMARTLTSAGMGKKDIVQVAFGYGLFTGGLGAHYGVEKIGASVVPMSTGNTKRQLMLMEDFGVTGICCTPSYALFLSEAMDEIGVDKSKLKLKYGVFGAEPWTTEMRDTIERNLGIRSTDIYGLSEIIGPGVSFECEARCGMHVNEDLFIPEIIDPVTMEVLPDGEQGELVITTITKKGMPLLRYRTRDITRLHREPCSCGRTLVRMEKVVGRSDDMLIIRGVNVFPSQIESVLMNLGMAPHYLLVVDRVDNLDTLEVQVEVARELASDTIRNIEALQRKLEGEIRSTLNIGVKVRLVEPRTIQRSEGKAVRVLDKRKQ
ncbi:phenylacetate--CoA ligase [Christensenella sp. MSJ-20]|uniref:phenylacetate--CoA ligase family protein n=1 Tax=Christensenella sp. MSJ-20 TaxID=2841518 RepID=UPI001C780E35|nr:phenylacetate--CoA ligase [Christensenella sp. MSJ-20]